MTPHAPRLGRLLWLVVSACAVIVYADDSAAKPDADWATACRRAKSEFTPLAKADLAKVKKQLRQAVGRLADRLDRDVDGGKAWKAYLKWDDLSTQLDADDVADLGKLDAVYSRLNRHHDGLDLVWFVDVRLALERYLNVARAIDNPAIKAAYERLLDALPTRLDAYAQNPTPGEAAMIGEAVAWIEQFQQADALVAAVRERFRQPNLFAQLSLDVVTAGLAQPVDETAPVHDVILGTRVHGTGHTKGTLGVEFFPDDEDAVVDTVLLGVTNSDTIGRNGPVRVYSTGVTRIGARKRFLINAEGIKTLPAVSDVTTSTTFDRIQAVRGGKFVERIAWKRACRDKGRAEAIASRHAEDRVNRRIDEQAEQMLAEANESFLKKFRNPLFERNLLPDPFHFSTTTDTLRVMGLEADAAQLAASAAPPALGEPSDVVLRVHESMINNAAVTMLADKNVAEGEFLKTIGDILGKVPERLVPEEGKEPWAVRFARREPFTVTFTDDGFRVAIHAVGYARGDSDYPGMNVAATYKIETTDKGFRAVRQGELEVFPPGFVPGKRRLSAREQTLRSLLQSRFEKVFGEHWTPKGILELPGRWSKAGKLRLAQWKTSNGWMVLAWNLPAAEE